MVEGLGPRVVGTLQEAVAAPSPAGFVGTEGIISRV